MNDPLEQKLNALHAANQPNAVFVNQLEQQLRLAHLENTAAPASVVKQNGHLRLRRRLLGIAASVVIISGLFAVIPPLRTLAQNIIDFFVPSEEYADFGDTTAYDDLVSVDTIEEAEQIAGFEAMEWLDNEYKHLHIGAGKEFISIAYERKGDRGPLLIVTKYRTGTRPEQASVGPDTEVQSVVVRGVEGQFVTGTWVYYAPDDSTPVWEPDHSRRLYWQHDGVSYQLYVLVHEVDTLEETVAIAEALE
jgi:hypothetical protein